MPDERSFFLNLSTGVRAFVRYSGRPTAIYSVMLQTRIDGIWTTIRLWDNAHAADEHHMHRHSRTGGKLDPQLVRHADPRQAVAAAIDQCKNGWQSIRDAYLRT